MYYFVFTDKVQMAICLNVNFVFKLCYVLIYEILLTRVRQG